MHLRRLFIKNFRSIQEVDVRFNRGKNVIVGRNNAGKSNILAAIDLVLGEASPDYKRSDNVTENDFCASTRRDGPAPELFIWCEIMRDRNEVLNFEELNKSFGFHVLSTGRGSPQRKYLKVEPLSTTYQKIFEAEEETEAKTYLNPKLKNQSQFEPEFIDKFYFAFAFRAQLTSGGIAKELRFLYRKDETAGWALGFKAHLRNALLQSAIIPSFRDPQNQLRATPWSWYGKLLRHLTDGTANLPKVQAAFTQLRSAANEVFNDAQSKITSSTLSVAFPGTSLSFQFSADNHDDLYRSCVIYVNDGFRSLLTDKGSGIQSATIIGLFSYYMLEVCVTGSALLGVEEPELYLHPHARRVLNDRFDEFIAGKRNQVILTSHSVEFVRSAGNEVSLILVRKGLDGATSAKGISLKAFQSLLRDNNQNELFFADKVILCEGFDEYVLKAAARELFPRRLDEANVSIIAVNGKNNIAPLARLILDVGLECFIFTDFDYLLRDKAAEREKYDAKAHDSVCSLPDKFFEQPCIFGRNGKKIAAELAAIRAKIKNVDESGFYTAKSAEELPKCALAPLLASLRAAGIGILDGEVEDLAQDGNFLSRKNKLTLDKVYELRHRILEGKRFSSVMRLESIREFLSGVFRDLTSAPPKLPHGISCSNPQ